MKWLRKLMLAAVLGLAVVSPLAIAPQAQANPGHGHVRYYYVYYRTCVHDSWHYYWAFSDYHMAQRYAQYIQSKGYEVYIY